MPNDGGDKDILLASIDAEIKAIDIVTDAFISCSGRRKAEYSKRRNILISRMLNLPTELQLAIISANLCSIARNPDGNRRRLASVCSHWRAIVFGWPQLWDIIALDEGPQAVARSLTLSKAVPFSVTGGGNLELLDSIGLHSHRCIAIDIRAREMTDTLFKLFENSFPLLGTLSLDLNCWGDYGPHDVLRAHTHIPFRANAPLCALKLSAIRIPLTSLNPSTLRILVLHGVKIPVEEWEMFLAGCLALEDLTVDQSMLASPLAEPTTPCTTLPRLRKLRFWQGRENIIYHTISLIDAPNLEEFCIDSKSLRIRHPGIQTFSRLLNPGHRVPLPTVVLQRIKIDHLQISYTNCGRDSRFAVRGFLNQHQHFCLVLGGMIRWPEALRGVHSIFPFGKIDVPVTLDVARPESIVPSDLDLDDVPTLTHLEAKDWQDLHRIYTYLSSPTLHPDGTTQWPCPELKELAIPSGAYWGFGRRPEELQDLLRVRGPREGDHLSAGHGPHGLQIRPLDDSDVDSDSD